MSFYKPENQDVQGHRIYARPSNDTRCSAAQGPTRPSDCNGRVSQLPFRSPPPESCLPPRDLDLVWIANSAPPDSRLPPPPSGTEVQSPTRGGSNSSQAGVRQSSAGTRIVLLKLEVRQTRCQTVRVRPKCHIRGNGTAIESASAGRRRPPILADGTVAGRPRPTVRSRPLDIMASLVRLTIPPFSGGRRETKRPTSPVLVCNGGLAGAVAEGMGAENVFSL